VGIRAVIWDLGGVILRTHDQGPRARWEKRLGLPQHELERLVFRGEAGVKAALGQLDAQGVWIWVRDRLGLAEADRPSLEADFWSGDRIDHELVSYIRSLRPAFKTALLSNAWSDLRGALEREWKIADAFDAVVISAEVDLVKPDPRIFRLALTELDVAPAEAVFVDDMPENTDAARSLGLRAVLFENAPQAMASLAQILGPAP